MHSARPILLVEDDTVDAMTVERAIGELKVSNQLVHSFDGLEALEYLRNRDSEKPCLILLDLNMPRMNGIEFLKVVKNDDMLKSIPVVVLTTSRGEQDKVESFRLSVAGYIVKSVDYKKFVETVRMIDLYWSLSELPNGE